MHTRVHKRRETSPASLNAESSLHRLRGGFINALGTRERESRRSRGPGAGAGVVRGDAREGLDVFCIN